MSEKQAFNNISDQLKKEISEKIKTFGPVLEFRLTVGRQFEVPTLSGTFEKKTVYPATFRIPERDAIVDPYSNAVVQIAAIDSMRGDEPVLLRMIIPEEQEGIFLLNTANPDELKWAEFLLASNHCGNNPHRSQGKPVFFELVDRVADSRQRMQKFTVKQTAMLTALSMDDDGKRDFAAAMNWNERENIDILSEKIATLAESDPVFFNSFVSGNGVEVRAVLKNAMTRGIVLFDSSSNQLSWPNGEVFAVLGAENGKTHLDMFAKWVISHPKGAEQLNNIKAQLAGVKNANKKAGKANSAE